MSFVPYSETLLAHQEPVQAISAWQQFNDITGGDALEFEMDLYWAKHPDMSFQEVRKIFRIWWDDVA